MKTTQLILAGVALVVAIKLLQKSTLPKAVTQEEFDRNNVNEGQ